MTERNEVTKILQWFKGEFPGCYVLKINSPSTSGILDIYFLWMGWHIWLEVKDPKYQNSQWKNKKIQEWHMRQIIKNGGRAYFVFSLEDVKEVMKRYFLLKNNK